MSDMTHSARDRPLVGHDSNNYNEGGEQNAVREIYPNELVHYGIPGMKWGIRRFQNPDGTLTAAGRRRYGTVENLERGMTKKQADEHEAAKKAAINSGKAAEVQKYSSELTREEMAYAVQRIRDEQTLSDLRAKDVAAGQQKVQAIIAAGGQLKTAGETVKSVYNLVAQANNAFNKNKLPIIGNQENDKKGDKPLSVEDQSKLFKLEQDKKRAATEEKIDDLIQKKGVDYIRDNPDKFTAEELQRALEYKKAAESDKWGRSNTSNSNSSSGGSSSSSTSSNSSKSGKSSESSKTESITSKSDSSPKKESSPTPTYSQPDNDAKSRADRDNSPKVSSLVSSDYARPSDMHESSAIVDRLADDVTNRGKSAFNRYWGFS